MYEPGDIVRLRSGGPLMTVIEVQTDGEIGCRWFREDELFAFPFAPATLIRFGERPAEAPPAPERKTTRKLNLSPEERERRRQRGIALAKMRVGHQPKKTKRAGA